MEGKEDIALTWLKWVNNKHIHSLFISSVAALTIACPTAHAVDKQDVKCQMRNAE